VRIRIQLAGAELARVRFAISPVYETVMALAALVRPGVHAVHLPWARWARPRLATVDNLPLLQALISRDGFKPGFLMPAPAARMPDMDDELRTVRSTSPADARDDTARLSSRLARQFHDDPRAGLPLVVDALRRCYDLVIAPHWDRMVRLLDADIAFRARALAAGGFESLFRLAAGLGVTAGAVSQHLAVLKDAGLVATHRDGRTTLHLRTDRAQALLA
jgi:DNA-binding transcriptional ArsR family regulator